MRIIIIDDELLQLNLLEKRIHELTNYEVIAKHTSPHQGLMAISKLQPDTVFLDVSMPGANGIELAKEIKEAFPMMNIIFLTAHEKYAVDAFNIQADDYLLKPINNERLLQAFSKIERISQQQIEINKPYICCFNHLHFHHPQNDTAQLNVKWRTAKAREIFAYLLHYRGKYIRKDVLIEHMWPDEDIKLAYAQLYSAIYQIRKTLATIEWDIQIISSESSYTLNIENYQVDIDIFVNGITNMPFITHENVSEHKKLLSLYTGDYFNEEDFSWAENKRRRLQLKYLNHAKRVAEFYIQTENHVEAILIYLAVQKIMPYLDETYFMLMKLYHKLNDRFAVQDLYHQLENMLWQEFKDQPSEEIVNWYEAWKKGYSESL